MTLLFVGGNTDTLKTPKLLRNKENMNTYHYLKNQGYLKIGLLGGFAAAAALGLGLTFTAVYAADDVTVTIVKYIDGAHANATNAEGQSFPMQSSWNSTSTGSGSGSFSLGQTGFNNPNPYEATTANMTSGASYSLSEDTSGSSVGANCAGGAPFALVGYTTGDSLAQAEAGTPTTTPPSLTDITTNKYIIVWNRDCTPRLTVTKIVVNDNGGTATTSDFTLFIDGATTTSGVSTTTSAGAHTVSETSMAGYTGTIGGDCDANGNVTLAAGDVKNCTITNNDNPPSTVKVTIVKFISGQHATANSAATSSFPMQSSWDAANLGGQGSGTFTLGPTGFNTPNAYEAQTADMTTGSDYSVQEDTSTSLVGANCNNGQSFRLVGYTSGNTLAAAQAGTPTTTSPSFTNFTSDRYVIVWNEPCAPQPTPQTACDTPTVAPAGYTLVNGTTGSDNVTLAPNTMFVGKGGHDRVLGGNGDFIICTGGGNDRIQLGNGNAVIEARGGFNSILVGSGNHTIITGGDSDSVVTGNGTQDIRTGGGPDRVTTGSGDDTINVGQGHNRVDAGGGNDTITAGAGNDNVNGGPGTDTCNSGGGFNSETACEL